MRTKRQLTAVIAGTTSIISLQLFAIDNHSSKAFRRSLPDAVLHSVLTLPANSQSNFSSVLSVDKNYTATQEAGFSKQYMPPINKNPKRSEGAGARGCDGSLATNLVTLLIPSKEYAGQTTSAHPAFLWHLSKPLSVPVRFVLVEPNVEKPLLQKTINSPKAGIIKIEMPKNLPELVPGRLYKWSVSLLCSENRYSQNPYFYSWIQRVPITADLKQKLAAATNDSDRAQIYARSGKWYDALAAISTARTAKPNDTSVRKEFLSLLQQVGLSQVAEQEQQQLVRQ